MNISYMYISNIYKYNAFMYYTYTSLICNIVFKINIFNKLK